MRSRRQQAFGTLFGLGVVLALLPTASRGQVEPDATPAEAPPSRPVGDLTTSYRFIQHFNAKSEPYRPGMLAEYRAAYRDRRTRTMDSEQGAPKRSESLTQLVVTERPAEVYLTDPRIVKSLVRHYDAVRIVPDRWAKRPEPKPMADLSVYVQTRPEDVPEILVLNPGRQLLEEEYRLASAQVFVPDLALVLPDFPPRVGDTWNIARQGASALVSATVLQGVLQGKLLEIRATEDGKNRVAALGVTGEVEIPFEVGGVQVNAPTVVNARLYFVFAPPDAADKPAPAPGAGLAPAEEVPIVDARGVIARVLVGQETRVQDENRRTLIERREFDLECRPTREGPTLVVPSTPPKSTMDNSWLTYVDPQQRFRFRFPQEFQVRQGFGADRVDLVHNGSQSMDVVILQLYPDRQVKVEEVFPPFLAEMRKRGFEVTPGTTQGLPESEWPGMLVARTEAVARPVGQPGQRVHVFGYALQFGRNSSLTAQATTNQEVSTTFRREVEATLKTFRLAGQTEPSPGQ